jgi:signal transduction histidine kinase
LTEAQENQHAGAARSARYLIGASFGLMLALLLASTGYSLNRLGAVNQRMEQIVHVQNEKVDLVSRLRNIARERSLALYRLTASRDPFEMDEEVQTMSSLAQEFLGLREKIFAMPLGTEERRLLEAALEHAYKSTGTQLEVVRRMQEEAFDEANRLLADKAIPTQNQLLEMYDAILDHQRQMAKEEAAVSATLYRKASATTLGLGAALILVGAAISIVVFRQAAKAETSLRRLNAELENRVEARTLDLKEANRNLQEALDSLREAQAQLVQSEKMASLGSLVAGMSHEINTPLGVSVTSASSLREETVAIRNAYADGNIKRSELEAYLEHADQVSGILLQNLKRAADLVSSFKQVAVDQSSEDWRSINLHAYADEILLSLRPKLKQTNVEVENACDPGLSLYTHPGVVYQILSNFILNSLVHAFEPGQGGHIRIAAREVDGHLHLDYRDDGRGVTADQIDHLFEPFYTTRRGSGGSGLGLHIVYNLVTNTLGGNIRVGSEPGQGMAFHIDFPLRRAGTPGA